MPKEGPTSVSTGQLVDTDLRAASPLPGGITLGVASKDAGIDISQKLADALPSTWRSSWDCRCSSWFVVSARLLVPLVATGGFALSLFATLGGTVAELYFQNGWLGGLFGVSNPDPSLNFLPTLLAGILFGLAMNCACSWPRGCANVHAQGHSPNGGRPRFKAGPAVVVPRTIVSVFGGFTAMVRPMAPRVRRPRGRVRGPHGGAACRD